MLTYDCEPSLTDLDVLTWCRDGYMMLEAVVPEDVNERVMAYCSERGAGGHAPVAEDWYTRNVTLNPTLAGVVRSLLGANFGYVPFAASHRSVGPQDGQRWHRDGGAAITAGIDCLQVFYLPQDTTVEMGPTEVVLGSHFIFNLNQYMGHYGRIAGTVRAAAPAGSIFVAHYGIWHRRSASIAPKVRNLLKFWYLRATPPKRDWIHTPGFDLDAAFHGPAGNKLGREMHRAKNDAAGLFFWLSGRHEEFLSTVPRSNLPVYFAPAAERRSEQGWAEFFEKGE